MNVFNVKFYHSSFIVQLVTHNTVFASSPSVHSKISSHFSYLQNDIIFFIPPVGNLPEIEECLYLTLTAIIPNILFKLLSVGPKRIFLQLNCCKNLYHQSQRENIKIIVNISNKVCLLYTSPSPRDATLSRMPSSA